MTTFITATEAATKYGIMPVQLDALDVVGLWFPPQGSSKVRSVGEPLYRTEDVQRLSQSQKEAA